MDKSVIQPLPPQDANEWDCQCARCGSSCESQGCDECGNDGWVECEDADDIEEFGYCQVCPDCYGNPVRYWCLSSQEWCEANPLPGREAVSRGEIEWFVVREGESS